MKSPRSYIQLSNGDIVVDKHIILALDSWKLSLLEAKELRKGLDEAISKIEKKK